MSIKKIYDEMLENDLKQIISIQVNTFAHLNEHQSKLHFPVIKQVM